MAFINVLFLATVVSVSAINIPRDGASSITLASLSTIPQSLKIGDAIAAGLAIQSPEPISPSSISTSLVATALHSTTSLQPASSSPSFSSPSPTGTPVPLSRSSPWIANSSSYSTSYSYTGPPHRVQGFTEPVTSVFFTFDGNSGSVSSCYTDIWKWWLASTSSASSLGLYSTSTYMFSQTFSSQSVLYNNLLTVTPIGSARYTTLCDGHPRLIGSAVEAAATFSTVSSWLRTISSTLPVPNYPPMPCSIEPVACSSLWSVYSSITGYVQRPRTTTFPPACPQIGTSLNLAKNLATAINAPAIQAAAAQVHYWPVRLADPAAVIAGNTTGNEFCKGPEDLIWDIQPLYTRPNHSSQKNYTMPATITPSATRPRIAVIDGITITSPTIAVVFTSVSNIADGDDLIHDKVVVTMPADQLMTVRNWDPSPGLHTIAYNDLNWVCEDKQNPKGPWTTQDEQGDVCYQLVPPMAYFGANERQNAVIEVAVNATSLMPGLTILNDYRPYIHAGPQYTAAITSLFGPIASWGYFGVMDPPFALTEVSDLIAPAPAIASTTGVTTATPAALNSANNVNTPVVPSNAASTRQSIPAQPLSTTNNAPPAVTLEPPTKSNPAQKASTSELPPPPVPTVNTSPVNEPPSKSQQNNGGVSSQPAQNNNDQQNNIPATSQFLQATNNQQNSDAANSQPVQVVNNPQTQNVAGSQFVQINSPPSQTINIGGSIVTASAVGTNIVIGGTTIQPGAATVIAGQQVSNPSQGGIVVGSGATASTIALSVNPVNTPLSVSSVAPGIVVVGGQSLTTGGSAKTLSNGAQVSLATTGVVMIQPATPAAQPVVIIGSQTVAASSVSSNVAVVASQTLTIGGPPGSFDGHQISLASNGIVIGTGSSAVTAPMSSIAAAQIAAASGLALGSAQANTSPSTIRVGSDILTVSGSNGNVLADARTTFTLSAGASAVTLNGQTLSAASSGAFVVVGNGTTSTATFAKQSNAASLPGVSQITSSGTLQTTASNPTTKTTTSASSSKPPGSGAARRADFGGVLGGLVISVFSIAAAAICFTIFP